MGHCCVAELLICLSACWFMCATARSEFRGRLALKSGDHELVYPIKVTESGRFVSHYVPHHFKRKRSAFGDDKLHYVLSNSEKSYLIELQPNFQLLSPGLVTEVHRGAGIGKRDIQQSPKKRCFYRGKIRDLADSYVALSTCYGLSGYIRTKRHTYFIEPEDGKKPVPYRRHPHVMYKHDSGDEDKDTCKTKGNLAKIMAKRATKVPKNNTTVAPKKGGELHIEALIVIDYSMVNYHKEINIENYVLTVFNMAHGLYHDASLSTNINLAIVRIIRLEEGEQDLNVKITRNATRTLKHFRDWQHEINPADDSHPNHHDIAVLLTRIDICDDENDCGLLGASIVGSICDPFDQVVLCEDNGLRLGFNIAHQIGHTLAIPHDTKEECGLNYTRPEEYATKVMSPLISIRITNWSPCSPKYLHLFLDSGFGRCLYDEPTEHSFELYDVLPGVMYDGDYQCKEIFGPGAALCNTGIDCKNLICYVEDKGCIETHTYAAPGTFCDEKKWCYKGECLQLGKRTKKVDGGWSDWSVWSDCSRSCGSGVSSQVRHCDNPPPSEGGKYCIGNHKKHRICSTDPCDVSRPSFKDMQCSEFNYWIFPEDNQMHVWTYYYMPEENPCVLFCQNDDGAVASLRPRVVDGTSCQRGIRDICIDGLCTEVPCDLNLESSAIEDTCGVCNGDGTSCEKVTGVVSFNQKVTIENEVGKLRNILSLPPKTVNVKVEQIVPTDSKLQLRSDDGFTIFVLGDTFGMHDVPGGKAWLGLIRTSQAALTVPGPIPDPLSIWVDQHDNVTVKYSYGIKPKKNRKPEFMWDYISWTRCSAECGNGIQLAEPSCIETQAGLVSESFCLNVPKPKPQIRMCEIAPCVASWFVGDWSPCSKCPTGSRSRVVRCIRASGIGEGETVFVSESECVDSKPEQYESCTCPTRKQYVFKIRPEATQCPTTSHTPKRNKQKRENSAFFGSTTKRAHHKTSTTVNMTTISTEPPLKPPDHGVISVDKDSPSDISLTLHLEANAESFNKTDTVKGKEAIDLINNLQKEGKDKI